MRKAKIVATIGPSSRELDRLDSLFAAGMNVARLNFSHGNHKIHAQTIRNLRKISGRRQQPLAIIADLPGPKIRTGRLHGGRPIMLRTGRKIALTGREVIGSPERVGINYPRLARDTRPGDRILLDDGLLELRVLSRKGQDVICRIVNGGPLQERKGVNLPGVKLSAPALTAADRKHVAFALKHNVDYFAQSFVRSGKDVQALKRLIRKAGYDTPVLAKIEKPEAVDRLEEILDVSDGIMVARGDLGVEMSPEQVPVAQKKIIARANARRLPVITATQMLESMIQNPRPTRAEASDVANAVYDGTDAVMLSAETASGRYPREAVTMMDRIIREAEAAVADTAVRRRRSEKMSVAETIAEAVSHAGDHLNLRVISVFTESGSTARLVSKHRPGPLVVGFSTHRFVRRRMALYWGVLPRRIGNVTGVEALAVLAEKRLLEEKLVRKGDVVGMIAGTPLRTRGTTNMMKLMTIGEQG